MFAMVSLGIGEILGGIVMGYIVDKIGPKKAALINVFLVFLQTVVVLAYLIIDEYSVLAYIMTFVWGV